MKNLLIIEDNSDTLHALSKHFERKGYNVKGAIKVDDVLNILDVFTPNLLISDWQLEDELDGVDLAKIISKKIPDIKIIFITGYKIKLLCRKITNLNVCTIIKKPFDFSTIDMAVNKAVKL